MAQACSDFLTHERLGDGEESNASHQRKAALKTQGQNFSTQLLQLHAPEEPPAKKPARKKAVPSAPASQKGAARKAAPKIKGAARKKPKK